MTWPCAEHGNKRGKCPHCYCCLRCVSSLRICAHLHFMKSPSPPTPPPIPPPASMGLLQNQVMEIIIDKIKCKLKSKDEIFMMMDELYFGEMEPKFKERTLSIEPKMKSTNKSVGELVSSLSIILGFPDPEIKRESPFSLESIKKNRKYSSLLNQVFGSVLNSLLSRICESKEAGDFVWSLFSKSSGEKQDTATKEFQLRSDLRDCALNGRKEIQQISFAFLSGSFTLNEINKLLYPQVEPETKMKNGEQLTKGKRDLKKMKIGEDISVVHLRESRTSILDFSFALSFIEKSSLGPRAGKSKSAFYKGASLHGMAFSSLNISHHDLFASYCALFSPDEKNQKGIITKLGVCDGVKRIGNKSFICLCKAITRRAAMKDCLSTYYTSMQENLGFLLGIVKRLELCRKELKIDEVIESGCCLSQMEKNIQDCLTHNKIVLPKHMEIIKEQSTGSSIHCAYHATEIICKCITHVNDCNNCNNIVNIPLTVARMSTFLKKSLSPKSKWFSELDSITSASCTLSDRAREYMAHIARAEIQKSGISERTNNLKIGEAHGIWDFKKKFEQKYFQESQGMFFGKRGMSILGLCVEIGGHRESMYLDIVIENTNKQDLNTVMACVEAATKYIGDVYHCHTISFQSDNASCFSTIQLQNMINLHNKSLKDRPRISSWYYTESQAGKTKLDSHFSFIGVVTSEFVQKGNNISTPRELFTSLTQGGGIYRTATALLTVKPITLGANFTKIFHGTSKIPRVYSSLIHFFEHINDSCILARSQCGSVPILMDMNVVKGHEFDAFPSETVIVVSDSTKFFSNILLESNLKLSCAPKPKELISNSKQSST
jgi:hypothetical protein